MREWKMYEEQEEREIGEEEEEWAFHVYVVELERI